MSNKKLDQLIIKFLRKLINKELQKLNQDDLQIISNNINQQGDDWDEICNNKNMSSTTEIIDDIYRGGFINLPIKTEEDAQLERRLKEIKFQQELRKDWILFIVKDVIVYSTTVLFIFICLGLYLFKVIF